MLRVPLVTVFVVISSVVSVLAVMLLARIDCVERMGGITDLLNNEATVDINCSVFTEFPPVILDTDRYFVNTFCVESWIYNAILFTLEVFYAVSIRNQYPITTRPFCPALPKGVCQN